MAQEISAVTQESNSFDVRTAFIEVFQNIPDGPARTAAKELFSRFNDYIEFYSGNMPTSEIGTSHQNRIAKLKATVSFFENMSQTLYSLGLITNWNESSQEMAKAVYERVREDRAKYRRAIKIIAEMYTVHMGGNGALFSIDALPDEIRLGVVQQLKSRKLMLED